MQGNEFLIVALSAQTKDPIFFDSKKYTRVRNTAGERGERGWDVYVHLLCIDQPQFEGHVCRNATTDVGQHIPEKKKEK